MPTLGEEHEAAAGTSRRTLWFALALLAAILLGLCLSFGPSHLPALASARPGTLGRTYPTAGVTTVDLDGFSGNIIVTATATTGISDIVQAGNGQSAADVLDTYDSATHTLRLYCAISGGCAASDYTVTVPEHVGFILRQISGQAQLSGLSGPVSVTATSANTTFTGLATSSFTAVITSGQLNATFAAVPGRVAVSVVSASASVYLPGAAQYAVAQHVDSGNVNVQVPQNPSSANTVDTTVTSGQISLMTS